MAKRVTRKDKAKDKALEDRMFNRLMDHIGPILADTFNKQNEYIMEVMTKTIEDSHKLIIAASIEDRKAALSELEGTEDSTDCCEVKSTDGCEAKKEGDDG